MIDHLPEKYVINNGIRIEYGKVFQFKNREFDIISKEEAKFIENVDKITIFLLNSCININLFDKYIKHYRENVGNYCEFVEKKIKYLYEWNELVNELNAVMDSSFERIVGIGKWILYFERMKANNVKEIFRVSAKSKNIRYYCVSHDTSVRDVSLQRPTDKVTFNTVAEVIDYIYGG